MGLDSGYQGLELTRLIMKYSTVKKSIIWLLPLVEFYGMNLLDDAEGGKVMFSEHEGKGRVS